MVEFLQTTQCYVRGISDFFFLVLSGSLVNPVLAEVSILLFFLFFTDVFFLPLVIVYVVYLQKLL